MRGLKHVFTFGSDTLYTVFQASRLVGYFNTVILLRVCLMPAGTTELSVCDIILMFSS
jgi:hypothetical protein